MRSFKNGDYFVVFFLYFGDFIERLRDFFDRYTRFVIVIQGKTVL
jgi:hypothetical protein